MRIWRSLPWNEEDSNAKDAKESAKVAKAPGSLRWLVNEESLARFARRPNLASFVFFLCDLCVEDRARRHSEEDLDMPLTRAQFTKVALSFPEALEKSSYGNPSIFIAK